MTIKQIQCLLTYLGYDPGEIDGANGQNTMAAVKRFQADYGLTVDSTPGAATQKMLIGAIAGTAAKLEQPAETAGEEKASGGAYPGDQYLRWDGFYHIPKGINVQLTKNFRSGELDCQGVGCCAETVISKRIMDVAQAIRDELGEPLAIGSAGGSGYRCKAHNAVVPNASPRSLHTLSEAVDLHYRNPARLREVALRHVNDGEIGLYSWGCHVGCWDRGYISKFNG